MSEFGEFGEFSLVVIMNEEGENNAVHEVRLGEGESFSHQARQSLAQSAVETLNMVCLGFGLALGELMRPYHFGLSLPDVGKAVRVLVICWNGLLQLVAGVFAAISNDKRHNLPCASAQGQPNPALILAPFDKTPNLIQF